MANGKEVGEDDIAPRKDGETTHVEEGTEGEVRDAKEPAKKTDGSQNPAIMDKQDKHTTSTDGGDGPGGGDDENSSNNINDNSDHNKKTISDDQLYHLPHYSCDLDGDELGLNDGYAQGDRDAHANGGGEQGSAKGNDGTASNSVKERSEMRAG